MRNIIRVLAVLSILVGAGVIAASAQINPGATVNVPFSFKAGVQTFEAGEYNVRIVKTGSSVASLRIQNRGSEQSATVLLREYSEDPGDRFELVFGDEKGVKYLAGLATANGSYLLVGGPERAAETLSSITNRDRKSKM